MLLAKLYVDLMPSQFMGNDDIVLEWSLTYACAIFDMFSLWKLGKDTALNSKT